jgi:protein O-GlcNAc transferase
VATVAEVCTLAFQHHQAGNLQQAEQLYHQVLQADPSNADALHLLGVLAYQTGQFDKAVTFIQQALEVSPGAATCYSNLGLAQEALGQMAQAEASYHTALRLQPLFAEAHSNLGKALHAQGKVEEAIGHLREALRIKPDYADAHNNLGNALLSQEKLEEAMACFRAALHFNPRFAKAYNNLGNALELSDRPEEAIRCYQQALQLDPGFAEVYDNLGITLGQHDRADDAIAAFQHAIQLKPHFAQAHYNLGCALIDQGRPDLARTSFDTALRLQPDMAAAQSNALFCSNYDPSADPGSVFAEHRRWGKLHESKWQEHENDPDPERRLRVGYVSPDFRGHALARYLEPVLAHHDKRQVTVFCYAEVARPDAMTARLKSLADVWRWTCRQTDEAIAQRIREDRIDILVDLAGHTRRGRLLVFALKPAPVQATWLGYMNTTGLKAMDYRLTDDVLDPLSDVRCPKSEVKSASSDIGPRTSDFGHVYDTEELVRLPGGMCCFAPPDDAPAVGLLPALGRGYITFGSVHSLFKVNDRVVDLWSQVLQRVPTARLLMFHHTITSAAAERLRRQFADRGIGSDRLEFLRGSGAPGYLKVYQDIDVSLDTFPCTGGVTTCESLWMGVPMLTLCGVRPAGRNSTSILNSVDLTEWIAQTPEEYLTMASRTASELHRLAELRLRLRDRMMATVCDGQKFTRRLEDAFRGMWRKWCDNRLAKGK